MIERSFEVLVLPYNGGQYKIMANYAPIGRAETVAAAPHELNARVVELQQTVLRGASARRGAIAAVATAGFRVDNRIIEEFGAQLFTFLFSNEVLTLYRNSLEKARRANERVRLKLRVDDHARHLSMIPWEALYDAKLRCFLSTGQKPVFTRTVDTECPIRMPPALEILGVIARPADFRNESLDALNVDDERGRISSALEQLERKKKA